MSDITSLRHQKKLIALLCSQMRLFDRSVTTIKREFRGLPAAKKFLDKITSLQAMVQEQHAAAEAIFDIASSLSVATSVEFMKRENAGSHAYTFLTNERKLKELIGELDEFNMALSAAVRIMDEANKDNPEERNAASQMSWRLSACQSQIHALQREAEAIASTESTLLRSYGLRFWQGVRRHLRWEGDQKP